jgi:hypothetical protein
MAPPALGGLMEVFVVPLHSTKSDTLPKVFLIIKQVVPYQTLGVTCCPGGSTPKNKSLAELSKTNLKP